MAHAQGACHGPARRRTGAHFFFLPRSGTTVVIVGITASGEIGFSYVLGRDHDKARLAALCDALWQNTTTRDALEREVLAPIRARIGAERARRREEIAASRVDFFTLVRGEDD